MKIEYTKHAEKDIKSINEPTVSRIKNGIEKLPLGDVKPIKGHPTYRRLRIGGYRVIFDMLDTDTIVIISVGPRGQAYRDF